MSDQFVVRDFARGVKLTLQHFYQPIQVMAGELERGGVAKLRESMVPSRSTYSFPSIQADAMQQDGDYTQMFAPFAMPPPQQLFYDNQFVYPKSPLLDEISFSWDQRAEAKGVTSLWGNQQTTELWDVTVAGTLAGPGTPVAGDIAVMTLTALYAVPNTTIYTYVVLPGDTKTVIATKLAMLALADVNYFVTSVGPTVHCLARVPGLWTGGSVTASYTLFNPGALDPCSISATLVTPGTTTGTQPEGLMTDADMARYSVVLSLYERVPTCFGGDGTNTQVLKLEIPGYVAFGNPFYRQNPIQINELNVTINPMRVYYWGIKVRGLMKGASVVAPMKALLAMPSVVLSARTLYPAVGQDFNASGRTVQNIPLKHNGLQNQGVIPIVLPATNSVIQGDTDIQHTISQVEKPLLDGLASGLGRWGEVGQEGDEPPWNQIFPDTGMTCIAVNLFAGWEDLRSADIRDSTAFPHGSGLPYLTDASPYKVPTADRRILRVPEGFVLHHVLAGWNLTSPKNDPAMKLRVFHDNNGVIPSDPNLINQVGVGLVTGWNADTYAYQQVAYARWAADGFSSIQVDRLDNEGLMNMAVLHVPLVASTADDVDSYYITGSPVWMGQGNSTTHQRSLIGQMPWLYGGGAEDVPATNGAEQLLEVRWTIQNEVNGLGAVTFPNHADDVIIGQGGHWVLLIGHMTAGAPKPY